MDALQESDKRKDALVEEVKKMRETGIRKSKFRISSDLQIEKHLQMNVSAWLLDGGPTWAWTKDSLIMSQVL